MPTRRTFVDPFTGIPLEPVRFARPLHGGPREEVSQTPPPALAADTPYPEGGTIADVLAWVDDPHVTDAVRSDRAKAATVAEHGRGKPRTTLLAELSERTT